VAELPWVTVTILFTHLEGSTRSWEEHVGAYAGLRAYSSESDSTRAIERNCDGTRG